ncbi:MAG: hypothetical protein AABX83_00875 [Nanoarchaeota archaeon]
MAIDISWISYFAPILAFLVVFVILFALLNRTKLIGENAWVQLFVSFLVATIFVSGAGVRDYVLTITPWFAMLVVSLFFVLFIIGFVGKPAEFMQKGIGASFIFVLIVIFLVSGFIVFSDVLGPYLPGNPAGDIIYTSRVFGALLLLVICAVVSWVLVASGKEEKKD